MAQTCPRAFLSLYMAVQIMTEEFKVTNSLPSKESQFRLYSPNQKYIVWSQGLSCG